MHADDLVNLDRRRSGLSIGHVVATAILIGFLFSVATAVESAVIDRTDTLYLAPFGGALRLDPPASGNAASAADSRPLARVGGNLWQSAGRWRITIDEFRELINLAKLVQGL